MSDVKVAFLTDSCSDIPQELTDKYGIDVIGFHIMLDGKEYLERKDMTNDQFYEMMRQSKAYPPPPPSPSWNGWISMPNM